MSVLSTLLFPFLGLFVGASFGPFVERITDGVRVKRDNGYVAVFVAGLMGFEFAGVGLKLMGSFDRKVLL